MLQSVIDIMEQKKQVENLTQTFEEEFTRERSFTQEH